MTLEAVQGTQFDAEGYCSLCGKEIQQHPSGKNIIFTTGDVQEIPSKQTIIIPKRYRTIRQILKYSKLYLYVIITSRDVDKLVYPHPFPPGIWWMKTDGLMYDVSNPKCMIIYDLVGSWK